VSSALSSYSPAHSSPSAGSGGGGGGGSAGDIWASGSSKSGWSASSWSATKEFDAWNPFGQKVRCQSLGGFGGLSLKGPEGQLSGKRTLEFWIRKTNQGTPDMLVQLGGNKVSGPRWLAGWLARWLRLPAGAGGACSRNSCEPGLNVQPSTGAFCPEWPVLMDAHAVPLLAAYPCCLPPPQQGSCRDLNLKQQASTSASGDWIKYTLWMPSFSWDSSGAGSFSGCSSAASASSISTIQFKNARDFGQDLCVDLVKVY
jgi:hypothetical protein